MPRKKRVFSPDTFYHVFNRGVAKMPIVLDDSDRRIFFKFLGEAVTEHHCSLIAYCLMDNHFHLMIKTGTAPLDKILWHLQSHFSRRINLRHKRSGCLFQGRYQCRAIDSDSYALSVLRYIHLNPIEAGMVQNPEDYLWSSYRAYIDPKNGWPWLHTQRGIELLDADKNRGVKTFKEFHTQKESDLSVAWPN